MISIVIPALNEEKSLPDCISSLRGQDWTGEYEIIVVDNGSTDRTAEIASNNGVQVITCLKRGVAFARQAGAEAAKGEIIVQVDADTIYPLNWLDKIDKHFFRYKDAAGLAGRYVYPKPAGWASFETEYRKFLNKTGILILGFPAAVSGANFAFRRSAFTQSGGYDPNSLYPDQWGIARNISKFGHVFYDHDLVVITSSRRVAKPLYVIFYEIIRNCCHVLTHFLRHCIGRMKQMVSQRDAG